MSKRNQNEILNEMRVLIGLNADGTRNGNGMLGDIKTFKKDIESINKNIISITAEIEEHSKYISEIKNDIAEIKKSLKDHITMGSIVKVQKATVGFSLFLAALSGIIGYIVFIASKLS